MNALRSLQVLVIVLLAMAHSFVIDATDFDMVEPVEYLPKRNFQHIWRNVQMQMPSMQQTGKRSESLSRARANAYYRLG